jgi:hypothetical protein
MFGILVFRHREGDVFMTKEEALSELKNTEEWHDFDYWVMLKLYAMGVPEKELPGRMNEEIDLHNVHEARLKLHEAEISLAKTRMRNAGASAGETNKYSTSHYRGDLIKNWRSLSAPLMVED